MKPLKRVFLSREEVHGLSATLEESVPAFKNAFIGKEFSLSNLKAQANKKIEDFTEKQRLILNKVLAKQYEGMDIHPNVAASLLALKGKNTVTITTGHQLSLATGPLFLIYKILHVIKLCESLNIENDGFHYVPVFWMASEDHDYEEVKCVHFFQKKFIWETQDSGALGRFSSSGLKKVYDEIVSLFNGGFQSKITDLLAIDDSNTYGQHYVRLINSIFGQYGLVVLDADQKELKETFIPVMEREIKDQVLEKEVQESNRKLLEFGKKPQAFVRPYNLFHLSRGQRIRIEKQNEVFKIGDESISQDDLLKDLYINPENFSPNALLRPLFQETVLPNVCYLGGSGELAYWTQLKSSFEHFNIPFPILKTRISVFVLKESWLNDTPIASLFKTLDSQKKNLFQNDEEQTTLFSKIDLSFEDLKMNLTNGIKDLGPDASKWTEAEMVKLNASISSYKAKWQKQNKTKFEQKLNGLDKKHKQLYPFGIPQERYQNLLHLCPEGNWEEWVKLIFDSIDPFEKKVHLLIANDETK